MKRVSASVVSLLYPNLYWGHFYEPQKTHTSKKFVAKLAWRWRTLSIPAGNPLLQAPQPDKRCEGRLDFQALKTRAYAYAHTYVSPCCELNIGVPPIKQANICAGALIFTRYSCQRVGAMCPGYKARTPTLHR